MLQIRGQSNDLHDSIIWSMRFDDNLFFDVDYLIGCKLDGGEVLNLIIPVTLVFYDIVNFKVRIETEWVNGIEIDQVMAEKKDSMLAIRFVLQEGEISFASKSYQVLVKGEVITTTKSCLTEEERGGYNFYGELET